MLRFAFAAAAAVFACAPASAVELDFLPPIALNFTDLNTGTNTAETDLLFFRIDTFGHGLAAEIFDGSPIDLVTGRQLYIRYKPSSPGNTDPYQEIRLVGFNGTLPESSEHYLARQSYTGLRGFLDLKFIGDGNALGTGVFAMDIPPQDTGGEFIFRSSGASLTRIAFQQVAPAVPEPETWALLILGFGAVGAAVRSSRRVQTAMPAR